MASEMVTVHRSIPGEVADDVMGKDDSRGLVEVAPGHHEHQVATATDRLTHLPVAARAALCPPIRVRSVDAPCVLAPESAPPRWRRCGTTSAALRSILGGCPPRMARSSLPAAARPHMCSLLTRPTCWPQERWLLPGGYATRGCELSPFGAEFLTGRNFRMCGPSHGAGCAWRSRRTVWDKRGGACHVWLDV